MKGHMNTKNGEISIENQVIAKYAGICALGCFGIVGMAMVNMKAGIIQLLPRDNIRKGVFVSVKNNKISIDFHIIVSYGVSISAVADNLMSSVKYRVRNDGISINIKVISSRQMRPRRTLNGISAIQSSDVFNIQLSSLYTYKIFLYR